MKEAHHWLNVHHAGVGQAGGEPEGLQETSQEQEQFLLGQLLAQAVALAHQEGDAPLVLPKVALRVDESVRVELLGLVPVCGIVHDV